MLGPAGAARGAGLGLGLPGLALEGLEPLEACLPPCPPPCGPPSWYADPMAGVLPPPQHPQPQPDFSGERQQSARGRGGAWRLALMLRRASLPVAVAARRGL